MHHDGRHRRRLRAAGRLIVKPNPEMPEIVVNNRGQGVHADGANERRPSAEKSERSGSVRCRTSSDDLLGSDGDLLIAQGNFVDAVAEVYGRKANEESGRT